jgi:hypothetical protein
MRAGPGRGAGTGGSDRLGKVVDDLGLVVGDPVVGDPVVGDPPWEVGAPVQPVSALTIPTASKATKSRRSIVERNRQECELIATGLAHWSAEPN